MSTLMKVLVLLCMTGCNLLEFEQVPRYPEYVANESVESCELFDENGVSLRKDYWADGPQHLSWRIFPSYHSEAAGLRYVRCTDRSGQEVAPPGVGDNVCYMLKGKPTCPSLEVNTEG